MIENRKVFAVISAAGSGKRMGAPIPKQFIVNRGKTILEQTVEKFVKTDMVDKVILVVSGSWRDYCEKLFDEMLYAGRLTIVEGGAERQDSVYEALTAVEQEKAAEEDIVLIHDGVRPYVSMQLIESVCYSTLRSGAVIPAVPPKDTIRHDTEGTLDRSRLWCVQTPQGFSFGLIKKAFERAFGDDFYGTDDASLVEHLGESVEIVPGEIGNIKITTPEDLTVENRIGTGYDVHRLVENRKLILGGVEIPYEKGLLGHSDADVLVHALMDAMLGAAALGDIGKLFPDNDDSFRNISSMKLLEQVQRVLTEKGYTLGNADVTVICQKPKLAGYIDDMRIRIAEVLQVETDRISIKATTTEKLGFTGRGEGIAAEAVCILNK